MVFFTLCAVTVAPLTRKQLKRVIRNTWNVFRRNEALKEYARRYGKSLPL